MGSGVLLAILVALWFVVLVPMVVTRGDLATAPAESMRVLRRRSDRSAMSSNANSAQSNSDQGGAGSRVAAEASDVENMRTEPIPKLPGRRNSSRSGAGTSSRAGVSGPPSTGRVGAQPVVPQPATPPAEPAPDEPGRGEIDIRGRRRRMLTGMVALAVLWALFAAFWQPVLWWPQIVLDLIVFGYLVFLRLEAQREQDREERRRAREAARVRLPEDRTERVVRAHTQYQAQVTAATEHPAIALDDDDPNLAQMPLWQSAEPVADPADWSTRKAV